MQLSTDLRFEIVLDSLEEVEAGTRVEDGVEVTSQGYWLVDIRAARTGLQSYVDVRYPEGKRVEFRHIEDVTDPASLLSWIHSPCIIGHVAWIGLKNSQSHKHGYAFQTVRTEMIDGLEYLVVRVCLDTEEIVNAVRSRQLVEVSAGYDRDFDGIPGVFDGVKYHGRQRNIRINHLAFLPPGMARAGQYARALLDGEKECLYFDFNKEGEEIMPQENPKIVKVQRVLLDSKTHVELEPETAEVVQAALDAKNEEIQTLTQQVSDAQGELSTANGRVKALEAEKQELQTKLTAVADAAEKKSVVDQAQAAGLLKSVTPEALDSLTVAELKKQAVAERFPQRNLDSVDSKEVDGMFSVVVDIPAPEAPKPALGSGNLTPGTQKLMDAMDKPKQGTQVNDSQQTTGRAAYLANLAAPTKQALGGGK